MKKRKKWIIVLIVIIPLTLIVTIFSLNNEKKVEVQTIKVERKDKLQSFVTASGEIQAKEFVDIQSEVTGIITEIYVKEGDNVKVGDLLLTIDPTQAKTEVEIAKAQLQVALAEAKSQEMQIKLSQSILDRDKKSLSLEQTHLEQAISKLKKIEKSFTRRKELLEDGLISAEEFENLQTELDLTKEEVKSAEKRVSQMESQVKSSELSIEQMKIQLQAALSRVDSAKANLAQAENLLNKTKIYAPINGVILLLNVDKGERAVPGIQSSPQATLMRIANMSLLEAVVKVDETDVVNLALGNEAKIVVDALPEKTLKGNIIEISNSPINEEKEFKVTIKLEDYPNILKPGFSLSADIITNSKENILVIPLTSLTIREIEVNNEKKEVQGVFIIDKVQRAIFKPVKTGIIGRTEVEVIEGLDEGDEIISGPYKILRTITEGTFTKIK